MKPQVGQKLYSSCSDSVYGTIIAVGEDGNKTPTIDIEVSDANDLCSIEYPSSIWTEIPLTRIEVPENTKVILRDLQYRITGEFIECNTPGNNCYRCTKIFTLK